jgi:hypothetical protein
MPVIVPVRRDWPGGCRRARSNAQLARVRHPGRCSRGIHRVLGRRHSRWGGCIRYPEPLTLPGSSSHLGARGTPTTAVGCGGHTGSPSGHRVGARVPIHSSLPGADSVASLRERRQPDSRRYVRGLRRDVVCGWDVWTELSRAPRDRDCRTLGLPTVGVRGSQHMYVG